MKRVVHDEGDPQSSEERAAPEAEPLPGARSAVLVPLQVDGEAQCRVTLIRRAPGEHRHAGQVAFPGGRYEPGRDESLLDTALRELEEEIGVSRDRVRVLGALSDRRTLSSNFTVTPFVGCLPFPCEFRACAREVARIFSLPIRVFEPGSERDHLEWAWGEQRWSRPRRRPSEWRPSRSARGQNQKWSLPCVRAEGEVIWGVTLDILDELLQSSLVPRR